MRFCVRSDYVARFIVNANHSVVRTAAMFRVVNGVGDRIRLTVSAADQMAASRKSRIDSAMI